MVPFELDIDRGASGAFPVVADALTSLRSRSLTRWRALPDAAWTAPSRCAPWTVHDVVRHVRDGCKIHVARLRHEPPVFPAEAGFDNQTSPNVWLEASAGESPADTLRELATLVEAEAAALAARDPRSDETEVGPYGPVHWTGFSTHMFWDAWIHERDIAVPLALAHDGVGDEDRVAAAYGVFVATIPALMSERPLAASVELTRPSSPSVVLDARPGGVAVIDGDGARTDLSGDLHVALDAIAGRGIEVDRALTGDPAIVEPFTWLRAFLVAG